MQGLWDYLGLHKRLLQGFRLFPYKSPASTADGIFSSKPVGLRASSLQVSSRL